MSDPIKFASLEIEKQWNDLRLNQKVREISLAYANRLFLEHGHIPTVTCIYRTAEEDKELGGSGIHTLWRAVDFRTKDMPPGAQVDASDYINGKYKYDQARPYLQVVYDKPHGSGPHAHLQVCAATVGPDIPNKFQTS